MSTLKAVGQMGMLIAVPPLCHMVSCDTMESTGLPAFQLSVLQKGHFIERHTAIEIVHNRHPYPNRTRLVYCRSALSLPAVIGGHAHQTGIAAGVAEHMRAIESLVHLSPAAVFQMIC
jgi:hypothetical protein